MLISYNWLKKFVKTDKSAQEIADRITISLAEVENINKQGDDYILEIENKGLTHRPDCFSHLGIAREIAAYFKIKLNDPLANLSKKDFPTEKNLPIKIKVLAKDLCYRYCGMVLTNVNVASSPNWLSTALERLGQKSINNVVDITNYVMFELGQPLHAFDYDKVNNHTIIVRKSKKGEQLTTIDGETRQLTPDMLVIADSEKPIGLAGIKGGANTEITTNTKTIILEAANFDAKNNRQTSKKINLRTEASTRFEKNLDSTLPLAAIKRTTELMQKLTGAKVASKIIDIQNKQFEPVQIKTGADWINQHIGFNLPARSMQNILNSLGIATVLENTTLLSTQPSWRQDINMQADLAEEIARVYGYDKIPVTLPQEEDRPPKKNLDLFWSKKVKLFLKGLGFTEVHTQPFVGRALLNKYGMLEETHLQLVNPLTVDQEFMRRSLVPSLLEVAHNNLKLYESVKIFEIDRVFIPKKESQPEEILYLTGAVVGEDFLHVKGAVESLLAEMGISNYSFKPYSTSVAELFVNSESLGTLGQNKKDINATVFNLNFAKLVKNATTAKQYTPIPKYPPLLEDMTFTFPPTTYVGPVLDTIKSQSRLIQNVELHDQYRNNFTFRITYQSQQKSLSSEDVKEIRKRVGERVAKKFNAKLK